MRDLPTEQAYSHPAKAAEPAAGGNEPNEISVVTACEPARSPASARAVCVMVSDSIETSSSDRSKADTKTEYDGLKFAVVMTTSDKHHLRVRLHAPALNHFINSPFLKGFVR